jgi:hypothetical protein
MLTSEATASMRLDSLWTGICLSIGLAYPSDHLFPAR